MHNLNDILNESYKLEEGAKFGEKEVNDILSRSGDFNIGIEYEFNIDDYDYEDVEHLLEKGFGIQHIHRVAKEHDEMVEVITKKMSLKDAIENLKGMFKFLDSDMARVEKFAGLHISISTNKYDLKDFNRSKFMVLLNSDYIHSIFPVRRHVLSAKDEIKKAVKGFKKYSSNKEFTSDVVETLESLIENALDTKYITATMKDYNMFEGRIELRFFGGENYHTMYDNIKQQMLRSLFIMELAYTDLYQKEYYKELYKYIKKDDAIELSRKDNFDLISAISKKDTNRVMDVLKRISDTLNPRETFEKLGNSSKKKIVNLFKQDAKSAFEFAEEIMQGRFEEGEDAIAENAKFSFFYSLLTRERFDQGEEKIFEELEMHEIERYVNNVTQFNRYNKLEAIEMFANMPTDVMENFIATVMDDMGEELTQEMGIRIFSLSSRTAEFGVEYLLNNSEVKNAENMAFELNNTYLNSYDTSLIDEDRIMEKVRNEKSPSLIQDIVSNVYLSDEDSIEVIKKIYNIFKKAGLGIEEDGSISMSISDMIQGAIANRSPDVREAFSEITKTEMGA